MRLLIFLLTLTLFSAMVSASCEEGQIDINSASLEELDQLYGIGPVKAQAIIDTRPFGTVDDLINVNGIGEITLNNIKSQGLACVDEENAVEEEDDGEGDSNVTETRTASDIKIETSPRETELQAINLNPQAIKTENSEDVGNRYAIYGLVVFSMVIIALLVLKNRKKERNEFT